MRNVYIVLNMFLRVQNELVTESHFSRHQRDSLAPNPLSIRAGSSAANSTSKVLLQKTRIMLSRKKELHAKGIRKV